MPPLTSVTATPTLNSLLSDPKSLQLPLHVYIYIQETLLYIFPPFLFYFNFPTITISPSFSYSLPPQRRKTPPKIRNSPSPAFLYPHDTCHYLINTTISRSFSLQQVPPWYVSRYHVCVCVSLARIERFQGGERFSGRKITRRGERNAGKRELTGRLRDERDPRPSLAMETGFGPLNWPLRSAAGPTRPCACANRPPPRVQRRAVGRGNPLTWTCSFSRRLACTLPISFTCGFSCSGGSTWHSDSPRVFISQWRKKGFFFLFFSFLFFSLLFFFFFFNADRSRYWISRVEVGTEEVFETVRSSRLFELAGRLTDLRGWCILGFAYFEIEIVLKFIFNL